MTEAGKRTTSRRHPTAAGAQPPELFISVAEVEEIELLILRRLRQVTHGAHRSVTRGSGFDYVGPRSWLPGDRFSDIDWGQSTFTNFCPLVVREFEQPGTATVTVVADASLSTRCGVHGVLIASLIARAIATIGLSATFHQDSFGLITFDHAGPRRAAIRPRTGRSQALHCLEAYQTGQGLEVLDTPSLSMTIGSVARRTTLVPFVSDFLFSEPGVMVKELSLLNAVHDVFIVLVDAAFAFELPRPSAGWVDTVDIETGRPRLMSRAALRDMAAHVRKGQDEVARTAQTAGIDVIRFGTETEATQLALAEFVAARRLRKVM